MAGVVLMGLQELYCKPNGMTGRFPDQASRFQAMAQRLLFVLQNTAGAVVRYLEAGNTHRRRIALRPISDLCPA
jgi:hypothetical protein